MVGSRSEQDAWVDGEVRRADPVRMGLDSSAVSSLLESTGHQILEFASREPRPRKRLLRTPKRLALIAVVVLGASGAAAAASGVFVNANTHTYNHGWQHIAGGPGENITGAGTNFAQVVRTESAGSGVVFPATYASWRTYEIKRTRESLCDAGRAFNGGHSCAQESTGMLNVNLAQDAFCTWILQWRQAKLSGKPAEARQAARVIAGVLRWKAVTDVNYIHGMFSESFAWMRPYMRAVAANDVSQINKMIGTYGTSESDAGGSYFWFNDPGFALAFAKRMHGVSRSREDALAHAEGSFYLRYLDQHGS